MQTWNTYWNRYVLPCIHTDNFFLLFSLFHYISSIASDIMTILLYVMWSPSSAISSEHLTSLQWPLGTKHKKKIIKAAFALLKINILCMSHPSLSSYLMIAFPTTCLKLDTLVSLSQPTAALPSSPLLSLPLSRVTHWTNKNLCVNL